LAGFVSALAKSLRLIAPGSGARGPRRTPANEGFTFVEEVIESLIRGRGRHHVTERPLLSYGLRDEFSHLLVSLTKGHALSDELFGEVYRYQELIVGGGFCDIVVKRH
jgi:hypothetical protein